jgi:hypothetical protein
MDYDANRYLRVTPGHAFRRMPATGSVRTGRLSLAGCLRAGAALVAFVGALSALGVV